MGKMALSSAPSLWIRDCGPILFFSLKPLLSDHLPLLLWYLFPTERFDQKSWILHSLARLGKLSTKNARPWLPLKGQPGEHKILSRDCVDACVSLVISPHFACLGPGFATSSRGMIGEP